MKTKSMIKSLVFLIAGLEGIQSADSMQITNRVKTLSHTLACVYNPSVLPKNNQVRPYSNDVQPLHERKVELEHIKGISTFDLGDLFGQEKYDLKDIQFFTYCKEVLNYNLYLGADSDRLISKCLEIQKIELKHIKENDDMSKAIEWLEITKINLYHSVKDLNRAREGIDYIMENYEEAKRAPEIRIKQYCKHLLTESHNLSLSVERYKNFDESTKIYIYDSLLFLCYNLIKKMNAFDLIYKTFLARNDNTKLVSTQDNLDPTTFKIIGEPERRHTLFEFLKNEESKF